MQIWMRTTYMNRDEFWRRRSKFQKSFSFRTIEYVQIKSNQQRWVVVYIYSLFLINH